MREIVAGGDAGLQRLALLRHHAADPRVLPADTTVINAYLQPILARYIAQLDRRLNEAGLATRQKYIMQSNGGMATFAAAARKAVTTVLSGPAGGVTAGAYACRMTGFQNIITFDMGGTSCDVALIKDGEPRSPSRGKIEGRDLAVPMMDINTVSAGGGTIASVDRFGVLEVGPQSAGAMPGPACYGRGGDDADHHRLQPRARASQRGQFPRRPHAPRRRRGRARRSRARSRAPLGMGVLDAAEGIVRIIDVKMEEAIKAISTMRGHDLRDFMLLAFGGAGPVHAGRIARDLGMAGMIVPLYPGVYSAIGLIMSDVKHDYIQSRMTPLDASSRRTTSTPCSRGLRRRRSRSCTRTASRRTASASSARSTCAMPARATRSPCRAARTSRHGVARRCAAPSTRSTRAMFGHIGAGGAGRDRVLSRARRRPGAAGRDAALQARPARR